MKGLYALVGMKHRGTEKLVASLLDGEPLALKREPDNRFDRNAVQVWACGQHVGYIKATQARPLALAMDGRPDFNAAMMSGLRAKLKITPDRWPMVEVEE